MKALLILLILLAPSSWARASEADFAQLVDAGTTFVGVEFMGKVEGNALLGWANGWQILGIKVAMTQGVKLTPDEFCQSGLVGLTGAGYAAGLWNVAVLTGSSGWFVPPLFVVLVVWRWDYWVKDAEATCKDPWGSFGALESPKEPLPGFFADQK